MKTSILFRIQDKSKMQSVSMVNVMQQQPLLEGVVCIVYRMQEILIAGSIDDLLFGLG
jgi:hypothetical protein